MEERKFIEVFGSIFDDTDVDAITLDTQFREIDEWSSLAALVLLAAVEDEYGVGLKNNEIKESKTVRDLFTIVQNKLS